MVLVLRTGVGLTRAYGPATVAALLHIDTGEVTGLERRALQQLRLSARTHACSAAGQALAVSAVLGAFGLPTGEAGLVGAEVGGEGGAPGAVEDPRYAGHAPRVRSGAAGVHAHSDGDSLLGINTVAGPADTWLTAVMIVVGVLLVALLFADDQWRSRWLRRPPR